MAPFLRRGLECFYCGHRSTQVYSTGLRQWQCRSCDAVNHLDAVSSEEPQTVTPTDNSHENGQFSDPPNDAVDATSNLYAQQLRRSASPLGIHSDDVFCQTCLKNQTLKAKNLADYLPEPSDPAYAEYERFIPEYSRRLDERYPQVCADCAPRVTQRLQAAGYAAKTDFLRQRLGGTQKSKKLPTRWDCPPLLAYGGCVGWWIGLTGQVIWHGWEVSAHSPNLAEFAFQLRLDLLSGSGIGLENAVSQTSVNPLVKASMWLAFICLWWNPAMLHNSSLGVSDPGEYYKLHMILMAVRVLEFYSLQPQNTRGIDLHTVAAIHTIALVFDMVVSVLAYRIGTPTASPSISFRGNVEPPTSPKAGVNPLREPTKPSIALSKGLGQLERHPKFPIDRLAEQRGSSISHLTLGTNRRGQPASSDPAVMGSMVNGKLADDDMMDLDTPNLQAQPQVWRSQPVFKEQRAERSQPIPTSNGNQAFGTSVASAPSHLSSGLHIDKYGNGQSQKHRSDFKFAEPRFFATSSGETGLESLMSGVFSLSDTPAELRETQLLTHPPNYSIKSGQSSIIGAINGLAFLASLAACVGTFLATESYFSSDTAVYRASLAITALVSALNLFRVFKLGSTAFSLSDALFYVLQFGVATYFAYYTGDCDLRSSSTFVYASAVLQMFVFVRSYWIAQSTTIAVPGHGPADR